MSPASDSKKSRPSPQGPLSWGITVEQIYWLLAAVLILYNARLFYGSLKMQTEHVDLWFRPDTFRAIFEGTRPARWSAPLDDVFIHFDFARATARGYPFEWIEGNGYSSGGTSLLYPFVLALGYLLGHVGLDLVHWAAIVACVGTFATLLGARRMFQRLPSWTSLVAPFVFLSVGALNWTLLSGMEVAVFLAFWALAYVLWDDLMQAIESGTATRLHAALVGLASAILVSCRPEAAPLIAVFGCWAASAQLKRKARGAALSTLLLVGVPGAVIVVAHMLANKMLTGDAAAAGALAKLEIKHPYLTSSQVWESWLFFLKYQFLRLSDYHFSAYPAVGYILWPLGLLSLVFTKTRRAGILLWSSLILWIAFTALNGQVRWQNERYTMPAVAWLLLAVSLGIAATLDWALEAERHRVARWGTPLALAALATAFVFGQASRFRDQVWFFGRASRNILEQHVRAAQYLKTSQRQHQRVLISDAGAIPYMSDLPAFDLIGLGGYGGLPIARASKQGVGAAIELLEHVPRRDLPDVMALYPSWWGDFVLWFGRRVEEFPVRGNVICGGASKVIYAPLWSPILHSAEPLALGPGERIVDTVDIADVLSEEAHKVSWDREAQGYVGMKLLPDSRNPTQDLWDAGRLISTNMTLSFALEGFTSDRGALLIRVAPSQAAELELGLGGKALGKISVEPADHWQEVRVPLPKDASDGQYSLRATVGEIHIYHLFAVEPSKSRE